MTSHVVPADVWSTISPWLTKVSHLLRDDQISEIMINHDGRVYVERDGVLSLVEGILIGEQTRRTAAQQIAISVGQECDEDAPLLDASLPDGSRVAAVLSPVSVGGTIVTIRKFRQRTFTAEELCRRGMFSEATLEKLAGAIADRKTLLLSGIPGAGKALDVETSILTPLGYVRLGDVVVGDVLFAGDGSRTVVTGVFPQGEKEGWIVSFDDGTSCICCDDHLWQVSDKVSRRPGYQMNKVQSLAEIRERIRVRSAERSLSIPLSGPLQFGAKDLPVDPYLLGVLIGNGGLHAGGIRLTVDAEQLAQIQPGLSPHGVYCKHIGRTDYRIIKIDNVRNSLIANKLMIILRALMLDVLSQHKSIPELYQVSDIDARVALFQGLMDTDGTNAGCRGGVEFDTSSPQLSSDFERLVRGLGCFVSTVVRKAGYKTSDGSFKQCLDSHRSHVRVPAWLQPFRIERKASQFQPRTVRYLGKKIMRIEPLGERRDMVCISISHPSGLFVINDGIVTHNTTLLNALAAYIPGDERIILIEDTSEIDLHGKHLVRMVTSLQPAVTIRDLLKKTLRLRPDRIIVGEVRGAEAFDLLMAMNSGALGTISTLHANSAANAIQKLRTYLAMSPDASRMSHRALGMFVGDHINVVIQMERRDGVRRVSQVCDVDGYAAGRDMYVLKEWEL